MFYSRSLINPALTLAADLVRVREMKPVELSAAGPVRSKSSGCFPSSAACEFA
jgi:hypothetical protein